MSDQAKGKAKPELEQLIEANGGKYYQTYDAAPDMICIGDKSKSYRDSGLESTESNNYKGPCKLHLASSMGTPISCAPPGFLTV